VSHIGSQILYIRRNPDASRLAIFVGAMESMANLNLVLNCTSYITNINVFTGTMLKKTSLLIKPVQLNHYYGLPPESGVQADVYILDGPKRLIIFKFHI
jgi:hypothetical protein